ncbi:MAG: hypothetical protein RLY40_416 [Pseudomonadota bacterium]|jgi:ankyrin repeat protein
MIINYWRENDCLFALAKIGDVIFEYWVNKKNIKNINVQDQDGDTFLHLAARGGRKDLAVLLLSKGALLSLNKKKRSALQEAYDNKKTKVAREITKYVIQKNSAYITNFMIQKNSVKNLIRAQSSNTVNTKEPQSLKLLINDFIRHLRKSYLDRSIFRRFSAKHNERARALTIAARRCNSVNEFKDLLNNQLNF